VRIRKAVAAGSNGAARTRRSKKTPGAADTIRSLTMVTSEERHRLICTAAYYRAQQRHFAPGCELEDWLLAEAEIDRLMGKP